VIRVNRQFSKIDKTLGVAISCDERRHHVSVVPPAWEYSRHKNNANPWRVMRRHGRVSPLLPDSRLQTWIFDSIASQRAGGSFLPLNYGPPNPACPESEADPNNQHAKGILDKMTPQRSSDLEALPSSHFPRSCTQQPSAYTEAT
jgi:hypothetical protein